MRASVAAFGHFGVGSKFLRDDLTSDLSAH
jgi:hypothetical protein